MLGNSNLSNPEWRFRMEHTKLSQSLEDYLEMVHILRLANGIARVRDIAAALTVKMPSVAKAMIELKKLGLVTQEPYSGVELTEEGERVAAMILNRHILLKGFLIKLGVSEAIADKDACCMVPLFCYFWAIFTKNLYTILTGHKG